MVFIGVATESMRAFEAISANQAQRLDRASPALPWKASVFTPAQGIIVKELSGLTSKGIGDDRGAPGQPAAELFATAMVDTTGWSVVSPCPVNDQDAGSTTDHEQRTTDSGNAGSGA